VRVDELFAGRQKGSFEYIPSDCLPPEEGRRGTRLVNKVANTRRGFSLVFNGFSYLRRAGEAHAWSTKKPKRGAPFPFALPERESEIESWSRMVSGLSACARSYKFGPYLGPEEALICCTAIMPVCLM